MCKKLAQNCLHLFCSRYGKSRSYTAGKMWILGAILRGIPPLPGPPGAGSHLNQTPEQNQTLLTDHQMIYKAGGSTSLFGGKCVQLFTTIDNGRFNVILGCKETCCFFTATSSPPLFLAEMSLFRISF